MVEPSEPEDVSETTDSDAPISVLGYGIMARLAQVECSGYELSLIMGPPRNFLWEAKHSQIYPVLAELKRAGCVTYSRVNQESKPDKKVYRLTDRGWERLRHWARQGPTRTPVRNEFYMKLTALWTLKSADAVDMLERQIEMLIAEVDMMDSHLRDLEVRTGTRPPFPPSHEYFGVYAAVSLTKQTTEATLATCRALIAEIQGAMPAPE